MRVLKKRPGSEDTEVEKDMTPMIDVVFQLIIFFMLATRIKELDHKLDAKLPKDVGPGPRTNEQILDVVIRVHKTDKGIHYGIESRSFKNEGGKTAKEHLNSFLAGLRQTAGKDEVPIIIDPEPHVPFFAVVDVLDVCRGNGFQKISFSAPPAPGAANTYSTP